MSSTPPTVLPSGVDSSNGEVKGKGKIAVDMDDVLCETNGTIVHMHNELYGIQPPLTLDDFQNYLYWQNRGWSTPAETVRMVSGLFDSGLCKRAKPVRGAKEGLMKLKEMGYSLIIVTARSEREREVTEDWIAEHLPDIFDEIQFTGAFAHLYATQEEKEGHVAKRAVVSHHKRSKAEVVHETGALFLIDDSAENALDASRSHKPCQVLLFGEWPWNRVVRNPDDHQPEDTAVYVEAEKEGTLERVAQRRKELLQRDWLPHGVDRVRHWDDVVRWVEHWEANGRPSPHSH